MSKVIAVVILALAGLYLYKSYTDKKTAEKNIQLGQAFLDKNIAKDGVMSTRSGLQYQVISKGSGSVHPKSADKVKVHYHGTLIDGTVFDSSVDRGEPITFGLNQVIPGWTEGLQLMVVGEKTRFFIPAYLAYGKRGTGPIEPGSLLIFEVELLGIE